VVFVLHIDRTEELNLVLRMLETLKTGEYTIRRLSAVLGFSTYSGRLQKTTLWDKLQNNGVFTPTERSSGNAVIYYFDWRKLREEFVHCNMVDRMIKATKRKIDRVVLA